MDQALCTEDVVEEESSLKDDIKSITLIKILTKKGN